MENRKNYKIQIIFFTQAILNFSSLKKYSDIKCKNVGYVFIPWTSQVAGKHVFVPNYIDIHSGEVKLLFLALAV